MDTWLEEFGSHQKLGITSIIKARITRTEFCQIIKPCFSILEATLKKILKLNWQGFQGFPGKKKGICVPLVAKNLFKMQGCVCCRWKYNPWNYIDPTKESPDAAFILASFRKSALIGYKHYLPALQIYIHSALMPYIWRPLELTKP